MKSEKFISEISLDDFIKQGRKERKQKPGKSKPNRGANNNQKTKKRSVSVNKGNKQKPQKQNKNQKKSSQKTSKLEVTNIALKVTNKELFDMFSKAGTLVKCKLITDDIGRSKGVAIVKYETAESATKAFKDLNGRTVKGRELELNFKMPNAQTKPDSNRNKKIKKSNNKQGGNKNDKKRRKKSR